MSQEMQDAAALALCISLMIAAVFGLDWVARSFRQIQAEEDALDRDADRGDVINIPEEAKVFHRRKDRV